MPEISQGILYQTAAIANAGTVSGAIDLGDFTLSAIITPAALTGTAITFQVSVDGTTYVPLYDATAAAVSVTVTTSRAYYLEPVKFAGFRYVKVVSGSAEGAARNILLVAVKAVTKR